jgi:hypothetical protein
MICRHKIFRVCHASIAQLVTNWILFQVAETICIGKTVGFQNLSSYDYILHVMCFAAFAILLHSRYQVSPSAIQMLAVQEQAETDPFQA